MFFSFPPFNCYLFAGNWKEFNWDQPGSCQQLELKNCLWGRCKSRAGGLFSIRCQSLLCGSLHHGQPGQVGLILLFYWDVDNCPWDLQWEEHRPRLEGFFSPLMGNRRWLGRNLAKRETFLSLPAWKKASFLTPASLQKAEGPQMQPRRGSLWGERGDKKHPVILQGMEQSWATSCVLGGVPNLPPLGGQ